MLQLLYPAVQKGNANMYSLLVISWAQEGCWDWCTGLHLGLPETAVFVPASAI